MKSHIKKRVKHIKIKLITLLATAALLLNYSCVASAESTLSSSNATNQETTPVFIVKTDPSTSWIRSSEPVDLTVFAQIINQTDPAKPVTKVEFYDSYYSLQLIGTTSTAKEGVYSIRYLVPVHYTDFLAPHRLYAVAYFDDGTSIKSDYKDITINFYRTKGILKGNIRPDIPDLPYIWEGNAGFKLEIMNENTSTTSTGTGSFILYDIEYRQPHTYCISKKGYLTRYLKDISITYDSNIESIPMWAGDFNDDQAINMADIMFMAKSFSTVSGDIGYDASIDLNLDQCVNMEDIMIAARHFGATSQDLPAVTIMTLPPPT